MRTDAPAWTHNGIELAGEIAQADESSSTALFRVFESVSRQAALDEYRWITRTTSDPFIEPDNPYERELDTFGTVTEHQLSGTEIQEVTDFLEKKPDDAGRLVADGRGPLALYATVHDDPCHQVYVEYDKYPRSILSGYRVEQKGLKRVEEIDSGLTIMDIVSEERYRNVNVSPVTKTVTDHQPWKYKILAATGADELVDDDILKAFDIMHDWEYRVDSEYGTIDEDPYSIGLGDALNLLHQGTPADTATAYARRITPSDMRPTSV